MDNKILVVDDEASVRELISSSVENFTGYDVDVAEDGFEAVKKVMSNEYDLICAISDCFVEYSGSQ